MLTRLCKRCETPLSKRHVEYCSQKCRTNRTNIEEINCLTCSTPFNKYKKLTHKKYCSVECYRARPSRRLKECIICSDVFIRNTKQQRTCSEVCRIESLKLKTKQCKVCGMIKPREEFGENLLKGGAVIRAYCKPCARKKHTEWCENKYFMYLMSLVKRSRRGSAKKLDCDIDVFYLEELYKKQNGKCAISGIPLQMKKNDDHSISIDRIDSNLSYTKDNVQLVCKMVNLMKHKFSMEQFLEYCKLIVKHKEGK